LAIQEISKRPGKNETVKKFEKAGSINDFQAVLSPIQSKTTLCVFLEIVTTADSSSSHSFVSQRCACHPGQYRKSCNALRTVNSRRQARAETSQLTIE